MSILDLFLLDCLAFSCLLQNNLRGGEKPILLYFKNFNNEEVILLINFFFADRKKCCNRRRLIWNNTANSTNTKMQYLTQRQKMKYTSNWHEFEFQTHGFVHLVPKEEVVYRRKMTATCISFIFAITVVE